MEKRKFKIHSIQTAVNFACIIMLLFVPLTRVPAVVSASLSFPPHVTLHKGWKMVDEASGIKEDLVSFSVFCKQHLPPYTNVLFFVPYFYYRHQYNTKYNFTYMPHRMRFYLYPIKVWWFKDKYNILARRWLHVEVDSKKLVLSRIDFIIGFALNSEDFPGFIEYRRSKEGGVILKRR